MNIYLDGKMVRKISKFHKYIWQLGQCSEVIYVLMREIIKAGKY